jgi:hypothetical protein
MDPIQKEYLQRKEAEWWQKLRLAQRDRDAERIRECREEIARVEKLLGRRKKA